jgi:hypothetical protein
VTKSRLDVIATTLALLVATTSCNSTDSQSEDEQPATATVADAKIDDESQTFDTAILCDSMDAALAKSQWSDYGVEIEACNTSVSESGDDVFLLLLNDPTKWEDLFLAMGDIPPEEAALYAFWRLPLGLVAIGFVVAETSPNAFDQMLISFNNSKETVYDVLPRDIAYVIDIPDALTKEQYSEQLNSRIDEVSRRVDVYNLNES